MQLAVTSRAKYYKKYSFCIDVKFFACSARSTTNLANCLTLMMYLASSESALMILVQRATCQRKVPLLEHLDKSSNATLNAQLNSLRPGPRGNICQLLDGKMLANVRIKKFIFIFFAGWPLEKTLRQKITAGFSSLIEALNKE